VGVDVAESQFPFRARSRSSAHSARRSLATGDLHFHSANSESAVDHFRALVSLVDRRRSRASVGSISAKPLFFCRNDRYYSGRIFLRCAFFQLDAVRVIVFRVCTILSGSGDLFTFHFAGKNQMGCLGFGVFFPFWFCRWLRFLPDGAGRSFKQLCNLFRARNYLRGAPSG